MSFEHETATLATELQSKQVLVDPVLESNIAIRVSKLTKRYEIYAQPRDRLKQFLLPSLRAFFGLRKRDYFREFWALKDVSFTVKKGETVGIVGRNGSGKSTLLQMVCGTLNPTSGSLHTNGRIAALLELGAGFNPDFTGRENVYLAASLYGLNRQQVDERFESITSFAEIGDFIDQPVKTYSSGMFVRLAFGLVSHVDADILVIDEALAVGDVFFQQKCMRFLRDFKEKKGTILFVTHDTGSVLNLCKKALLLYAGGGIPPRYGDAEEICKYYLEDLYRDPLRAAAITQARQGSGAPQADDRTAIRHYSSEAQSETLYSVSAFRNTGESFGEQGATIIDARFVNEAGDIQTTLRGGDRITFIMSAAIHQRISWPAFGFMFKNSLGEYLYTEGTDMLLRDQSMVFEAGDVANASFSFEMPHLIRGKYLVNVAFAEGIGDEHIQHHWIHDAMQIDCLSSRVAHGYSGMNGLKISVDVKSTRYSQV